MEAVPEQRTIAVIGGTGAEGGGLALRFASGSPLQRECAIRFVVGVNGSGKSNLLRAVAEVFLALADERLPPFPVSLIYELGRRGPTRRSD